MVGVDRIAVVLGGDVHLSCGHVANRVVASTVSELELECTGAENAGQHLVSQTDTHNGLASDELAHGGLDVAQQRRVTGSGRKHNAVRLQGQYVLGRHVAGNDGNGAAQAGEYASDVVFQTAVHGDCPVFDLTLRRCGAPLVGRSGGHISHIVHQVVPGQPFEVIERFAS